MEDIREKITLAEVPISDDGKDEFYMGMIQMQREVPFDESMQDYADSIIYEDLEDIPDYRYLTPKVFAAVAGQKEKEEESGPQMC